MCAIIGAVFPNLETDSDVLIANIRLNQIVMLSKARGRDGIGFIVQTETGHICAKEFDAERLKNYFTSDNPTEIIPFGTRGRVLFIANLRAEPTTEYVKDKRKEDQQPYTLRGWSAVHNGTIANDKEIRAEFKELSKQFHHPLPVDTKIDSAAIVEQLYMSSGDNIALYAFLETIQKLKGSYAIAAINHKHMDSLFLAANYRPLWAYQDHIGAFFASSESFLEYDKNSFNRPFLLEPYSNHHVRIVEDEIIIDTILTPLKESKKALVVCSGGLDSVVAATIAKVTYNFDVTLLHFKYGSRAEGPEEKAVREVAHKLGGLPIVWMPLPIYSESDSPLLQADSTIAGGEEGAEFAHEWVPARNLAMLSVATAYAEAHGFTNIILGNNLEEAGAYPDNEPEFINQLNKTLRFAVGDGVNIQILMPVGNMMKHEIVKEGLRLGAPLDSTWSCYRAGKLHCGKCGPCFMRKTAFEINNAPEVITYEV